MYAFNYHAPDSIADVSGMLQQCDEAQVLAGGMTLLPTLKQRLAAPSDLVDLRNVSALQGITAFEGGVRIGAMTTHASVASSEHVKAQIPALAELALGIGDAQVRHRGTLGGAIANNDPAADYPAALLALAAVIETDQREIAASDFFTGMFDTALHEHELIIAVRFAACSAASYAKFPNPASGYAMAGVFVARPSAGDVRVAVTGAAACAYRAQDLEQHLSQRFDAQVLAAMHIDTDGFNEDIHADAAYRGQLVRVMTQRAVEAVRARGIA